MNRNFVFIISTESGTYDQNGNEIVNAWFVGFAPFDNPEIAVVGMVENGWHGSYVAENNCSSISNH